MEALEKGKRRIRTGKVVSDKMDKTRVVAVERMTRHSLYGKTMRRTTKFKVHDPQNDSNRGDTVKIEEARPMSKEKRWRLMEVVEKSKL